MDSQLTALMKLGVWEADPNESCRVILATFHVFVLTPVHSARTLPHAIVVDDER